MPAKITASVTDNQAGLVSISDVNKMIDDYVTKIELHCTDTDRNPIQKHHFFDLRISKLQQVIDETAGAQDGVIRIHLALNLPDQLNCTGTYSLANYLSILVCARQDGNSLLRVDDSILAGGFADFATAQADCCVQGNPPYTAS